MISIIIPNYNGIEYLERCVRSLSYEGSIKKEIIIVDNASKDSDYNDIKARYPDIIWIQLRKNYGFSRAVNEGIRRAKGEYIILLNNDTEICEDFVEVLVGCIQKDPKIFSVCGQMIQYYNKHLIDDAGDEYNILGWAYKRGDGYSVGSYNQEEEVFSSCAGAAIYRNSVFEEIGYFDESFFAYMEDIDISYRARIYGYKNVYCPEAKVYHIGSATSGSKYNAFKVKLAACNNIYVVYKNMPLVQLIINLPFLLVGFLIKYIFFVKKGFAKEYKESIMEGIRTVNKIEKVKFRWRHLSNYIKIEFLLIKNTFSYVLLKLKT